MSFSIFSSPDSGIALSNDGTMSNPLRLVVSQDGGVMEQRLYVKSYDLDEGAADGKIRAMDAIPPDESSWISFAPDLNGAAGIYVSELDFSVQPGEEFVFWVRVSVPEAQEQQIKTDLRITLDYVRVAS